MKKKKKNLHNFTHPALREWLSFSGAFDTVTEKSRKLERERARERI